MTDKNEIITVDTAHAFTPMTMIEKAMASDADVERLEKLWDLQVKYEEREAKKAFVVAMSAFRSECPSILKTCMGQSNPFAGLGETSNQIKEHLSNNGLSFRWETAQDGGQTTVSCIVTHILGHSESTSLTAGSDTGGNKNAIQSLGSTVKYLQRYTMETILGLSSTNDDDGKDADAPLVEVINEDQYANLDALMEEVKANRKGFFTAYKIPSLEMLPATMYDHAVKSLEAKRK